MKINVPLAKFNLEIALQSYENAIEALKNLDSFRETFDLDCRQSCLSQLREEIKWCSQFLEKKE